LSGGGGLWQKLDPKDPDLKLHEVILGGAKTDL